MTDLEARAARVKAIAEGHGGRMLSRTGNVVRIEVPADLSPGPLAALGRRRLSRDLLRQPLRMRHPKQDMECLRCLPVAAAGRTTGARPRADHRTDTATIQRSMTMTDSKHPFFDHPYRAEYDDILDVVKQTLARQMEIARGYGPDRETEAVARMLHREWRDLISNALTHNLAPDGYPRDFTGKRP